MFLLLLLLNVEAVAVVVFNILVVVFNILFVDVVVFKILLFAVCNAILIFTASVEEQNVTSKSTFRGELSAQLGNVLLIK